MRKAKKETKSRKATEPTVKPADISKVLDDHGEDYKCLMKDGTIKIVSAEIVPKELLE